MFHRIDRRMMSMFFYTGTRMFRVTKDMGAFYFSIRAA